MKKNISYREKLLELSNIYKISEIQNYIKRFRCQKRPDNSKPSTQSDKLPEK